MQQNKGIISPATPRLRETQNKGIHQTAHRFNAQMKRLFCFLLYLLAVSILVLPSAGKAQSLSTRSYHYNSLQLHQISFVLHRIERQQQAAMQDPVFLAGSYPSYIHHRRHFKQKKKDITIFYNILIDMTLKKVQPVLPDSLRLLIDTLLIRSSQLYPRFYNQSRGSYNFWLRDSSYRFPYSWWIPLIKKDGAVPDDMDDTVLSRFVDPKGGKDSLDKLHRILQEFVRRKDQPLRTAPRAYRHYYTYSTWFGKKFPVVLDAVVLSNILSFVSHYQLEWTRADTAALQFIIQTIQSEDYINRPLAIAPYYGKTAILLYHYARLLAEMNPVTQVPLTPLDSLRPELMAACQALLHTRNTSFMEKVITTNALHLLEGKPYTPGAGEPDKIARPLVLTIPDSAHWTAEVEHSDFAYFIGNISSYMSRTFQGMLHPVNAMMYYHYCPAFNDVLVLRYLVGQ